jgi:hypothetical protein
MEEILLTTRSQNEVIKAGSFEEMDPLLIDRKSRMDAIDKLDEQFAVYSSRLKSILSLDSFEDLPRYNLPGTAELKNLVVKINEKLSEIRRFEDENNSLVKKELNETREKINHSNTFKRVSGAYYPVKNEVPSYYFDKKK